jgi:peptidoglycan endopeptidase LytE
MLAPLALFACVVALFLIVRGSGGGGADTAVHTAAPTVSGTGHRAKKTYVVKSGDSLSVIAERNGITLARLLSLNPGLDPQTLQAGQRIRLRP